MVDKIKSELNLDITELIEKVSPMGTGPGGLNIPYAYSARGDEWDKKAEAALAELTDDENGDEAEFEPLNKS